MLRKYAFIVLALVFVSCTCTKDHSTTEVKPFSAINPFYSAENEELWEKPQKPFLSLHVLGDLNGQLVECGCFIRPNGGLVRIQSYFNAIESNDSVLKVSLGSFHQKRFVEHQDLDKILKSLELFFKESSFDAILLSEEDLAFFKGLYKKDKSKLERYLASLPDLPWVFSKELDDVWFKKIKKKEVPKIFGAFDDGRALSDDIKIILSQKSLKFLTDYIDDNEVSGKVYLTSNGFMNNSNAEGAYSSLVYVSETKSRSVGHLTLWDSPDANKWVNGSNMKEFKLSWDGHLLDAGYEGTYKEIDSKIQASIRKKDISTELHDLIGRLLGLRKFAPDLSKPFVRYSYGSINLGGSYNDQSSKINELLSGVNIEE